mgnify:CR=1 FL=1
MKAKLIKTIVSLLLVPFVVILIIAQESQPSATEKDDASKIDVNLAKTKFIEAKCNTCHAYSEYSIEAKNKSPNNKAPDISKVELKYDREFIAKYLLKEEQINNKKHPVAFKGSVEDLNAIISLMLLHKTPDDNPQKTNEEQK